MTTQQKELQNVIDTLPEELSHKVIDYVEYLKFAYIMNEANVPADLVIKSEEDLVQKLEKGIKSTDSGNVCSLEETMAGVNKILAE